uniref:LRAT domain-containing protein n=1 Tax=Acrobeloides nanus TaxID=290746 RepID=A0A914CDD4_9BILA
MEPGVLTSEWKDADELGPYLELGDCIEFKRVLPNNVSYSHWALHIGIFDGERFVAHISNGPSEIEELEAKSGGDLRAKIVDGSSAQVRSDKFSEVAGRSQCRINNEMDKEIKPYPPIVTVERALLKLGSGNYNLLFNNCEHFVRWCRYGSSVSDQALTVASVLTGSLLGSAALVATGSFTTAITIGAIGYAGQRASRVLRRFRPYFIRRGII